MHKILHIIFILSVILSNGIATAQSKPASVFYKPVENKKLGIWPNVQFWNVENYKSFREEWGLTFILVPAFENRQPALSRYYSRAIESGYTPDDILMIMKDTLYQTIVDSLDAVYYYIGEPVEHDCIGNPTSGFIDKIYSPQKLTTIKNYIHDKRPGSEFIIDGYKRCSHFKIAGEIVDRVMYSSYTNWRRYGIIPFCFVNIGWGDDFEYPWENSPNLQSDSWSDMRSKFGAKFNMTWMDGRGDEYDQLFQKASSLGLETVWFYGSNVTDLNRLNIFCESAVEHGWLEKVDSADIDPPSELTSSEIADRFIRLTWQDNSDFENGSIVEKSINSSSDFFVLDTLPVNTTTYIDTLTEQSTEYYYRVKYYNNFAESGYSNVTAISTSFDSIAAPSYLILEFDDSGIIELEWLDNSDNESGFIIEKSINSSSLFFVLDSVSSGVTSYSDTQTQQVTQYYYRIKAYNNYTESGYSTTSTITTPADPITPPSELSIVLDASKNAVLNWIDNSINETGFIIEKSINTSSSFTLLDSLSFGVTNYVDSDTEQGEQYFYRIKAFNSFTESDYSNISSVIIPIDSIPAPQNLIAIIDDSRNVQLTWEDNSGNENGFIIERKIESNDSYSIIDTIGLNLEYYLDNSVIEGNTYIYRIRAFNSFTVSNFSNTAKVALPFEPINSPTNLSANYQESVGVVLNWDYNTFNELGFIIERKLSGDNLFAIISKIGPHITSYTDVRFSDGNTYVYRIKAYNQFNQSGYSNTDSVTIPFEPINTPDNLSAFFEEDIGVHLNWNDNSENELGFIIERKPVSDTLYTTIDTVGIDSTNYIDINTLQGSTYNYRVKAFNQFTVSEYSFKIEITIPIKKIIPPSNLSAEFNEMFSVTLQWIDNSDNELGFIIERKLISDPVYSIIDTVGIDTSEYADSEISGLMIYEYRIKAYNQFIESAYSDIVAIDIPHKPISPPISLSASITNSNEVLLSWIDNSDNESGFIVERKLVADQFYSAIDTVDQDSTIYKDSSVIPGTIYNYRIMAFNQFLQSPYSDNITIEVPHRSINVPSNLMAVVDNFITVELSWIDNSNNESGFIIERKITTDSLFATIDTVEADSIKYRDSTISNGFSYDYRISAFNEFVNSDYSNIITIEVPYIPITPPSNLTADLTDDRKVSLSWQDNSDNELGFIIERKFTTDTLFSKIDSVGINTTKYRDSTVADGSSYNYKILAFNQFIQSDYSNSITAVIPHAPVNHPSNLSGDITDDRKIILSWEDNSDNELGFTIERKFTADTMFSKINSVDINSTEFRDTTVVDGSSYNYRVMAFNQFIQSDYSNSITAVIPHAPVNPPSNLSAHLTNERKISLTWDDNSDNEQGFIIEKKIDMDTLYFVFDSVGINIISYTDSSLIAGKQYLYRIKAFNEFLKSEYSNSVSLRIPYLPITPPSDLSAILSEDSTGVELSWSDNSSNENGFVIERKIQDDANFNTIDSVFADVGIHIDTSVISGNFYNYRVFAFNDDTTSDYSNSASLNVILVGILDDEFENYSYKLDNNYPNPFNPSTTFRYEIAKSSSIEISFYNSIGELVHKFHLDQKPPGRYSYTWHPESIPSGIYIIRFSAVSDNDVFSISKKIIYLK